MLTEKATYGGYAVTPLLLAWSNFSGAVSVTFGSGALAETSAAMCPVSSLAVPGSKTISSPTARPLVRRSRTPVSPAVAAALSVVLDALPRVLLPAASAARSRYDVPPSPVAGGRLPPVTGRSTQVAPLSIEYCSEVTPTLSLAVTAVVTGPPMYQLPLPVDVEGAAGGLPLRCGGAVGAVDVDISGGVVSSTCPDAGETTISAALSAAADAAIRNTTLSPSLPDHWRSADAATKTRQPAFVNHSLTREIRCHVGDKEPFTMIGSLHSRIHPSLVEVAPVALGEPLLVSPWARGLHRRRGWVVQVWAWLCRALP